MPVLTCVGGMCVPVLTCSRSYTLAQKAGGKNLAPVSAPPFAAPESSHDSRVSSPCLISRYLNFLLMSGNLEEYMEKLITSFNPEAAEGVMCRDTISIGWDGTLYDCDFNQMLEMETNHGAPSHIKDFDLEALNNREIMINQHCFGCTAGAGSSCGGATT